MKGELKDDLTFVSQETIQYPVSYRESATILARQTGPSELTSFLATKDSVSGTQYQSEGHEPNSQSGKKISLNKSSTYVSKVMYEDNKRDKEERRLFKKRVFSNRSIFQLDFKSKEKNALCGGNVP